ncbi:MAG: vitamin K epoxide reductase, partial [Chlamydiae bacterium RIFCSPHIGHO2_02_FULL_45_9]
MQHDLKPEIPRPWTYNPSSWNQRVRVALVALIAVPIALYLGLYQWGFLDTAWDPIFGDGTKEVIMSDLSHTFTSWIRVPDAILGALAYLSDIIFALAGSERRWQDRPWLVVIFGIDVIPLGFVSAILVILQGFAIESWCFLCLVSAAISLILIVLAYDEVLSCCLYLCE